LLLEIPEDIPEQQEYNIFSKKDSTKSQKQILRKESIKKKQYLTLDTDAIEERSKYNRSGSKRADKCMSKTFQNLKTPEHIMGRYLDAQMRLKMSHKKGNVLRLEINIMSPKYDAGGAPVIPEEEEEDEEDANPHSAHFNIHLLDEDYLNAQPYLGE